MDKAFDERVPRMMSIEQVAETGILKRNTIYAGCRAGWIPHIRVGKKYLVNYDKLLQVMEDC